MFWINHDTRIQEPQTTSISCVSTIAMVDHLYEPTSCLHPKWWFSTTGIPPQIPQKFAQIRIPEPSHPPTRILHPVGGDVFLFFRQSNVCSPAPLRCGFFPGEVGEPGTLEYRMHFKDGTDGTDGPWSLVGVLCGWMTWVRTNLPTKMVVVFFEMFVWSGLFIFWKFFLLFVLGRVEK